MLIVVYLIGIINYLLLFNFIILLKFEFSSVNSSISFFINEAWHRKI